MPIPGDIGQMQLLIHCKDRQQEIIILCDSCIDTSKKDWDSHETSWVPPESLYWNN